MSNVYLKQINATLPRLLSLFDTDSSSESYGIGDRYRWAWCLTDFGNGTYQGAAHGLARLLAAGQLPASIGSAPVLARIDSMFQGAASLRRRDGSMEEAFPYEGSYCVTALVAFDLLSSVELLDGLVARDQKQRWLSVVRPMISFLRNNSETHAIISNHLATAAAALFKWGKLSGEDVEIDAVSVLRVILDNQSEEGWFDEYGGADPGYQSLCTYYLADIHRMRPDLDVLEPVRRSIMFLSYFIHPDGSVGGIYGSRCTRFYYPAGLEYFAAYIPEAAAISNHMRTAIDTDSVVGLLAMDDSNLVPMFNAYCWAAVSGESSETVPLLPCHDQPFRRYWPEAGLLVERGDDRYTIVSVKKGGVCYNFEGDQSTLVDAGVLMRDRSGKLYSSQAMTPNNSVDIGDEVIEIRSSFTPVTRRMPTPLQFIILRLLSVTLMRFSGMRELIKRMLVRMLISGTGRSRDSTVRVISLGETVTIEDTWDAPGLERVETDGVFTTIHMASQGYWQQQDDR